jgi:hypothetical protein
MSITQAPGTTASLLFACAVLLAPRDSIFASDNLYGFISVSSKVSKDYLRTRLPGGAFEQEDCVLAEGGHAVDPSHGSSTDKLEFSGIVRNVAAPLMAQNYIAAKDLKTAKLLVIVYWGTTKVDGPIPATHGDDNYNVTAARFMNNSLLIFDPSTAFANPNAFWNANNNETATANKAASLVTSVRLSAMQDGPRGQAEDEQREKMDARIYRLLGYDSATAFEPSIFGKAGSQREELIAEVKNGRYFVVLMAYDLQSLLNDQKRKLEWVTRFSIDEAGNEFAEALPVMANRASRFFGEDSHGLSRMPAREGNADAGFVRANGPLAANDASRLVSAPTPAAYTLAGTIADGRPDLSPQIAALKERVAAYQQEKAGIQNALDGRIASLGSNEDTRPTINAFNAEHSAQISALRRDAEDIKTELAKMDAASQVPPACQQSEDLVRRFVDEIRGEKLAPLLAQP